MRERRIRSLLEEALRIRIGSAIAASYGRIDDLKEGTSPREFHLGRISLEPRAEAVTRQSFFDLASLTKILLTTLLAMKRVEEGHLALDGRLDGLLPEYVANQPSMAPVTVRHLLAHASGLPAWRPFFESLRSRFGSRLRSIHPSVRRACFDRLVDEVAPESGAGERIVYSDVGFLLLERLLSSDLTADAAALYDGIPGLKFRGRLIPADPAEKPSFSAVSTEICPWRGELQGEVHDDNAWSRGGGLSGHAGLFGRLCDVQLWVESLFKEKWVSLRTLRRFAETVEDSRGSARALGFDVPARDGSGATGFWFSPSTIGHLGFTGTSLWMDLDSGHYAILLVNRVHPARTDDRIRKLRRSFHEEVRT